MFKGIIDYIYQATYTGLPIPDGGAFPEIHVAQYPLGMGARGKESTSNALAVQLDESGHVKYSAIARQGHSADKVRLRQLL